MFEVSTNRLTFFYIARSPRADTVSTQSKPVRGQFKSVLHRSQYVLTRLLLIVLNSPTSTSFTDRSPRSHYVLISSGHPLTTCET